MFERISGGAVSKAELPDTNPDQDNAPESIASSGLERIGETASGKPRARLIWNRSMGGKHQRMDTTIPSFDDGIFNIHEDAFSYEMPRHAKTDENLAKAAINHIKDVIEPLEASSQKFDELMAAYDAKINLLKQDFKEISKQLDQAIIDIAPDNEPQLWVEHDWDRIKENQKQEDKKPATDEDKTDEVQVVSKWPGGDDSVFTTTLPAPADQQVVPQTNLGAETPPPGPGDQTTGVVEIPQPIPARPSIDSRSKHVDIQEKKITRREWLDRNRNKIIGGAALVLAGIALWGGILASDHHDHDQPENRTPLPATPTEQAPDFAANGIVTPAEMRDRWVSQVYAGEALPYGEMLENAGSAISSGDARVVYQWDGTYFYKVTPKAMNSFGLHGDPTSTPNVMKVLAAHSDGDIKIAR
jgi:hypothetical protein